LAWRITDDILLVPIRLSNPLLETEYPEDGFMMAVLDTGYTGFILVPPVIFRALKLNVIEIPSTFAGPGPSGLEEDTLALPVLLQRLLQRPLPRSSMLT
jgi:hypothetical protein